MDSFTVGTTPKVVIAGDRYERVLMVGSGSTVYYKGDASVSASSNDGSLAAGARVRVRRQTWVVSAGESRVVVVEDPDNVRSVTGTGTIGDSPGVSGTVADGIADDRGAIQGELNAYSAAGGGTLELGGGTYGLGGALTIPANVNLHGRGSTATTFKALNSTAGITYGPDIGATTQRNGLSAGWQFDGNLVSTVGVRVNATQATFQDLLIQKVNGDGLRALGQNCLFLNVNSGNNAGASCVLDNGAGDNEFERCEFNAAGTYHVEFRSSADSTSGAYLIPEENIFRGGILETAGAPSFPSVNGGIGLGSVHHLAGSFNHFDHTQIVYQNGTHPAVYMEPNTRSSHSGDANGRLYFDTCTFIGVPTGSTSAAIEANHVTGGVAGGFNTDVGIVLRGHNVFSGYLQAIKWGTSSTIQTLSEPVLYTCPTEFGTNGSGASASMSRPGGSAQLFPDDISVTRDAYVGGNLNIQSTVGGRIRFNECADPAAPGANFGYLYMRDNGSGKTQLVARFPTGAIQVITTEP